MANKVKDIKKKGRRLKRSIRKTLGTLFLVSALVVAAIPVDYLQADEVSDEATIEPMVDRPYGKKVTITDGSGGSGDGEIKTNIPDITNKEFMFEGKYLVYSSADLVFNYVVSNIHTDAQYAVIVGYNNQYQQNNVEPKVLTIPDTVDAYTDYSGRSCAIGGTKGELLFYRILTKEAIYEEDGITIKEPAEYKYEPCLYQNRPNWITDDW